MKVIYLLFCAILIAGCKSTDKEMSEKEPSFLISGTITGDYDDYIFLSYNGIIDSTLVVESEFSFKGNVDNPYLGTLRLNSDPAANLVQIYVENSNINIEGEYGSIVNGKPGNFLKLNTVSGSRSRKIIEDYQTFYQENEKKENFKELLAAKLDTFVVENADHPFTGAVLADLTFFNPILSSRQLKNYFSQIDTTRQNSDDLAMFKMGLKSLDKYGMGKTFINDTLPNQKGVKAPIFEIGKVTLVDFWASWCAPCRDKHPDLISLNEKFKGQDFEIVSISIDSDKSRWLKAIEDDGLEWKNLIDADKKVNNQLGILAVPYNYLVDREGILLDEDLTIEEIETKVSSLLLN